MTMDKSPYSPPRAQATPSPELAARKPWIAVVLTLFFPSIGMLYVARPVRAIGYLSANIAALFLAVMVSAQGAVDAMTFLVMWWIGSSVIAVWDVYRLAKRWSPAALPWYSRPPALIGFLLLTWSSTSIVRAFVAEPFKIPSMSMTPTLRPGDHILVNKAAYSWRLPFDGPEIVRFSPPRRGDVAVFRYPDDPRLNYVMRVIGLPGDAISYVEKRLRINGKETARSDEGLRMVSDGKGQLHSLQQYREEFEGYRHSILLNPDAPTYIPAAVRAFPSKESCSYMETGFSCKVPAGHYFVLGDSRDFSSDSRYWGFVPEADFVGRAYVIWYSSQDAKRGGMAIK